MSVTGELDSLNCSPIKTLPLMDTGICIPSSNMVFCTKNDMYKLNPILPFLFHA